MAGSKQQDLRKWSEGCFGLINPLDQFLGAATQGKQNGSVAQVDEIKMKVKRFPTMIKILVCGCQCVTSIWTFWMLTNTIHHPDLSSPPKINNPHFSSLFSFTISFPSLFIQWIGSDPPPPRLWTLYWSLSTSRMLASSHNPLGHTAHCRLAVSDPQPSSVHLETGTLGSTHSIHVIEIGVLFHKELANLIAYLMEQCTFSDTRLQRMTNILS